MNNITEIICIIDKSGSMSPTKGDTIGGYNGFINEQRKLDGKAKITTVFFNYTVNDFESSTDLQECKLLDDKNYSPNGGTALLDAIGLTIENTNKRLIKTTKNERLNKVLCVIITDGEENASKLYNKEQIFDLIEHQTELHGWEFIFLGANQDAIKAGSSIGIRSDRSMTFSADSKGFDSVYTTMSNLTMNYRNCDVETNSVDDILSSKNWSKDIK
jgi:uncharacterized protein YegL